MNEIVPSISIQNLLNQRAAVEALLVKGIEAIRQAETLAKCGFMGFPEFSAQFGGGEKADLCSGYKKRTTDEVMADCLKAVDAGAWGHLMTESGLMTFMDARARSEWHNKIHQRQVPALTFENIEATFATLHGSRDELFERGVLEVFRHLNWDYKTNKPFRFGKKLILTRMFSVYGTGKNRYLSSCSTNTNALDDLERVFHIFDELPEPDHRQGWYQRIAKHQRNTPMFAESDFLSIKWFLNGNAHVEFKRLDLVEKLNLILAKHFPGALAYDVHV